MTTYHPDLNKDVGAEDNFKEIVEIYEVLGDAKSRAKYDQMRQRVFAEDNFDVPPPDETVAVRVPRFDHGIYEVVIDLFCSIGDRVQAGGFLGFGRVKSNFYKNFEIRAPESGVISFVYERDFAVSGDLVVLIKPERTRT